MIEKGKIERHLKEILSGKDMFLVEVKVNRGNTIKIHIDKMQGISIEDCVAVSRELEGRLDREIEDFALEVSSPGLDAPFRVSEQYDKNIGKRVSVQLKDSTKVEGILKEAGEDHLVLAVNSPVRGKDPGIQELAREEILSTRLHIQF